MIFDEKKPFYEVFDLNYEEYIGYSFEDAKFGVRLTNRLYRLGDKDVSDLLKRNMTDLRALSGFGRGCEEEICAFFSKLNKDANNLKKSKENKLPLEILEYRNKIMQKDFSFENELSDENRRYINLFKEGFENIDVELLETCVDNPEMILPILKAFNNYIGKMEKKKTYINSIPSSRLNNKVIYFIKAYTVDENIREVLFSVGDCDDSLDTYIDKFLDNDKFDNSDVVKKFLAWCKFNVQLEVNNYLDELKLKERNYQIVSLRAQKKTLEQVGTEFGVTRERVRQIEAKVIRNFDFWRHKKKTILKIYAEKNGMEVITPATLEEYFGEDSLLITYLLKASTMDNVVYDTLLDAFIVGNESLPEKVMEYVDGLPETFNDNNLKEYIDVAVNDYDLPEELVIKQIEESFKHTGVTYHRSRLTLEKIYIEIMDKYYPDGMHVYDTKELDKFRKYVEDEFGVEVTSSNRGISAVLGRIGILCGRGTYRHDNRKFISDDLLNKIITYIENSDSPIFLTNTIFSVFEDELINEGIDNKYFLQGILHKECENRWIFRRDYISKDESFTSVYTSIVSYIRDSAHPVSKEDITNAFPGVTEIVVNISVSDPDILNLFGTYIHSNKIRISDSEKEYLRDCLNNILDKKDICHCREIYNVVDADYHSLLINNYVDYPFSIYSLLEYLFRDEYNFSRPFIAGLDAKIETVKNMLHELVEESDRIEIEEIRAFSKENHIGIYSILEFIDSCNKTHLLINETEVMQIELTGIDCKIAEAIESEILKEVVGTIPISHLQCINNFPKVEIKWTEWLIYSVIKKWGVELDVAPSANQFRQSIPLIARKGKLDTSEYENISTQEIGTIVVADDLNNIDELIGDYLLEGLEGLDDV